MSDLEEGELESDEDITTTVSANTTNGATSHTSRGDHSAESTASNAALYRHKPPGLSSSDDSSDSDDDPAIKRKRRHNLTKPDHATAQAWFNPNRQGEPIHDMRQRWAQGPTFWTGEMTDISKFSQPPVQTNVSNVDAKGINGSRKRKNNVWGSVLAEQSLSHGLGSVGVINKDYLFENDRSVESYDYLAARQETDGEDNEGRRGNKRSFITSRLGSRKYDKDKSRTHVGASADDTEEHVWKAITRTLKEQKESLIERVVKVLGKKKSLKLLYLTEDIEETGGLWTVDGSRRRTPGGVYLQLLKSDDHVTKEHLKEIFLEENKQKEKERKKARAFWRKKKADMVKQMSGNLEGRELMSDEEYDVRDAAQMDGGEDVMGVNLDSEDRIRGHNVGDVVDHVKTDKVTGNTGLVTINENFEIEKNRDDDDGIVLSVDPHELEIFS